MPETPSDPSVAIPSIPLHSLETMCPFCSSLTPHRVLHLRPHAPLGRPGASSGGPILGVARCLTCRTTHPFTAEIPREVQIPVILSEGATSALHRVHLPREHPIRVGDSIRVASREVRIQRVEWQAGTPRTADRAHQVRTLWTVPDDYVILRMALAEGARTLPLRARVRADFRLVPGDLMNVEGRAYRVQGYRVGARTYDRPGPGHTAQEISRVYLRSAERPPAGSSDWRSVRPTPRSRDRLFSTSSRSRSSPGRRSHFREAPERENEEGGAH